MKDAFGNDFWVGDDVIFSMSDGKLGRGIVDRIVNTSITTVYIKGCSLGISPDCICNIKNI